MPQTSETFVDDRTPFSNIHSDFEKYKGDPIKQGWPNRGPKKEISATQTPIENQRFFDFLGVFPDTKIFGV